MPWIRICSIPGHPTFSSFSQQLPRHAVTADTGRPIREPRRSIRVKADGLAPVIHRGQRMAMESLLFLGFDEYLI